MAAPQLNSSPKRLNEQIDFHDGDLEISQDNREFESARARIDNIHHSKPFGMNGLGARKVGSHQRSYSSANQMPSSSRQLMEGIDEI